MEKKIVIGVDIGGTTISAGCLIDNMLTKKAQANTGAERSANEIIETLVKVIERVWVEGVKAIGIGIPGYLNPDSGEIILINNIPSFKGVNIKQSLSNTFNVPVFIENDANCFALGEFHFGSGTKYSNLIGITLGTGLGGGIILNGKLVSGLFGGAGELGCIPFRDENFEVHCSSKFFEKHYQCTGKELFIRAENGDVSAQIAFNEFGQNLGNLILNVLYFAAPEAIIVGGSISKSFKYFIHGVRMVVSKFPVDIIRENCRIEPAQLINPGIMGAAALYYNQYTETQESKSYIQNQ